MYIRFVGRCFALLSSPCPPIRCWTPGWLIVLLLCAGMLYSCGAPSPSASVSSTSSHQGLAARQQLPQGTQPQATATEAAHPFHATTQTFDSKYTITLDITPNRSGTNVFTAWVMDNQTKQPVTHIVITLYTTMQDMPMGTNSIVLHDDGNGQFSATSDNLIMGGKWAIGITIIRSDRIIHKAGVMSLVTP
ncbi:MAG TPA: FixH family protein [Ktedonobacteraceae bacterium]|nr:FixH family protein [Ktedonobacteraceae bacterium]